ncbi:hypothetical protein [Virgisporangium aurantiacum]|nr:hypothetical protein [Virgisporangium aurantiacum]
MSGWERVSDIGGERVLDRRAEPWPLINVLVDGRLLTPVPAD